jgi:hypothetical protein
LNLQWLRSLYLARVHVAAPTGGMVKEGSRAADALAASMSMDVGNNNPTTQNVPSFTDHDDENEPMGSNTAIRPVTTTTTQHSQPHSQPRNRPSTGSFSSVMGGVDPFWQDDSSVQLLTPIPQQPSVADMSAASSSLFFGDHSSARHRNHNPSTMLHEEEDGNGQDNNNTK